MGFFTNLMLSPMKKKLRQYAEFLSVGTDEEIAMTLAVATLSRKLMIQDNRALNILFDGSREFIYIHGNKYISDAQIEITAVTRNVERLVKIKPSVNFLMGGYAVWKMTIYSLMAKNGEPFDPEAFTQGRIIWKELKRGIPYVNSVLKDMEENGMPIEQWHYDNCQYIPEIFNS